MKIFIPLLLVAVLLSSFKQPGEIYKTLSKEKYVLTDTNSLVNAGKVCASLYQQRAAEYKAQGQYSIAENLTGIFLL